MYGVLDGWFYEQMLCGNTVIDVYLYFRSAPSSSKNETAINVLLF